MVSIHHNHIPTLFLRLLPEHFKLAHDGQLTVTAVENIPDLHHDGVAAAPLSVPIHHPGELERLHHGDEIPVQVPNRYQTSPSQLHARHRSIRVHARAVSRRFPRIRIRILSSRFWSRRARRRGSRARERRRGREGRGADKGSAS